MENETIAKKLFKGVFFKILGKTTKEEKLVVDGLFTAVMESLEKAWKKPMKEVFG